MAVAFDGHIWRHAAALLFGRLELTQALVLEASTFIRREPFELLRAGARLRPVARVEVDELEVQIDPHQEVLVVLDLVARIFSDVPPERFGGNTQPLFTELRAVDELGIL